MKTKIIEKVKSLKPIHYLVIFLGVIIYIGIIIGVVNYRANRVVTPPRLDIITPVEGDTYSSDKVLIQGQTDPRETLIINDQKVKADKEGEYSAEVPLQLGENSIRFEVTKGKLKTEKIINVKRVNPVAEKPRVVAENGELNNSGPETLWVFEAGMLAAAGAAYQTSKKRLELVLRS